MHHYLQNEELLIHLRVYSKSAIAQTDEQVTTDGPLCTGNNKCCILLDLRENNT